MRRTAFWLLTLLLLPVLTFAQSGVRAVVVNDSANVRIAPAFGAEIIAHVPAGYFFDFITGRSGDSQWLRVDFNGEEGWVHTAPLTIIEGDINSLPVGDPRSIPYGGFESPRAGQTSANSPYQVRITNGLRVRAGPGQGYPTLANMFANTVVPVFGRTVGNGWLQVNFEGTLGWISVQYVELLGGFTLSELPIDGIVADSPPLSEGTSNNYIDTLKLMLSRLDLAQPALDSIRAIWTDAALNGRVSCHYYPPQPSDYNVPVPVLAAFFPTLDPLQTDFNSAMADLRHAIDLLIQTCNQPGLGNPVGQATIIGSLDTVNRADSMFASLRERLRALIPPDREAGPNECLFTFQGRQTIIPLIGLTQIIRQRYDPRNRTFGYCIDLTQGQVVSIEALRISGTVTPMITLSPFDNPTNFLGVARSGSTNNQITLLSRIIIPATGRYLIISSHRIGENDTEPVSGELALVVQAPLANTGTIPNLAYDPTTDTVYLTLGGVPYTPIPGFSLNSSASMTTNPSASSCPSVAFQCNQFFTCQEAYACLGAGNKSLDPDNDGIPCENICSP